MRTVQAITIDSENTRLHDDAFWVTKTPNGFIVYISISNVADSVEKDSFDDKNAAQRCFSTTVTMLPRPLAEILSLTKGQERETITIAAALTFDGDIKATGIERTKTAVSENFSFSQTNVILKHSSHVCHTLLSNALEAALLLSHNRRRRGSLAAYDDGTFFTPQMTRGDKSRFIISEFMILANVATARYLKERNVPMLFRNCEKRGDARELFLEGLLASDEEQDMMKYVEVLTGGHHLFTSLFTRQRYSTENRGNAFLKLECYMHITSPLRRFADLVNQRILLAVLDGTPIPYAQPHQLKEVADTINHVENGGRPAPLSRSTLPISKQTIPRPRPVEKMKRILPLPPRTGLEEVILSHAKKIDPEANMLRHVRMSGPAACPNYTVVMGVMIKGKPYRSRPVTTSKEEYAKDNALEQLYSVVTKLFPHP